MSNEFKLKRFIVVTLLVNIWVNVSEVFRYFVFVMPATRKFFSNVPGVAPMNWDVFSIWDVWDTILTTMITKMDLHFYELLEKNVWH
jgi:hypothetical protein